MEMINLKLLKGFPEQPINIYAEFFINPKQIGVALINHVKDTGKFQLWVKVDDDSFHVGTYDTLDDAHNALDNIFKE